MRYTWCRWIYYGIRCDSRHCLWASVKCASCIRYVNVYIATRFTSYAHKSESIWNSITHLAICSNSCKSSCVWRWLWLQYSFTHGSWWCHRQLCYNCNTFILCIRYTYYWCTIIIGCKQVASVSYRVGKLLWYIRLNQLITFHYILMYLLVDCIILIED